MKKCFPSYKILICMMIFAIIASASFYAVNANVFCTDYIFHYSRLLGIIDALKFGSLKQWISYGIYPYGYAVNICYPDVFLIPFCFLSFFHIDAVAIFVIIVAVLLFSTNITAYYVYDYIFDDAKHAFWFSFLYTYSLLNLHRLMTCGIGKMFAYLGVLFVMLGLYSIYREEHKRWWFIVYGLAIVFYSNMVFSLVVSLFIVCVVLVFIRRMNQDVFKALLKACVVSTGVTALAWLPFLEFFLSGSFDCFHKQIPVIFSSNQFTIEKIMMNIYCTIENPVWYLILFLVFLGLCLCIGKFYRGCHKGCLLASLVILYLSSSIFPWSVFDKYTTVFANMQLPFRFTVLFDFFFLLWFVSYYDKYDIRDLSVYLICLVLCLPFFGIITNCINDNGSIKISTDADVIDYISSVCEGMGVTKYGLLFEYMPGNYCLAAAESLNESSDIDSWYNRLGLDKFIKEVDYSDMNLERLNATTFAADLSEELTELPLFYYPCYEVTDGNGMVHSYHESHKGFVEVDDVTDGHYTVRLIWTAVQKASLFITLISLLLFSAVGVKQLMHK